MNFNARFNHTLKCNNFDVHVEHIIIYNDSYLHHRDDNSTYHIDHNLAINQSQSTEYHVEHFSA